MLAAEKKSHPISRKVGYAFGDIPSFDEYLNSNFSGSENKFWEFLLEKHVDRSFIIYTDDFLLKKMIITFLKNVFEKAQPESLYLIYKFYFFDNILKVYIRRDYGDATIDESVKDEIIMSFDEFNEIYKNVSHVSSLQSFDKTCLSFEFLMMNYFVNPNSYIATGFIKKLKYLSWKTWFNDMSIMKSEILNSVYDINQLYEDIKFNEIDDITIFIANDKRLSWIVDKHFNIDHIDYVKAKYSKELFTDLTQRMHKCWGVRYINSDGQNIDKFIVEDSIVQTNFLYDEDYIGLLNNNINKKFGCIFINDELMFKANQILASHIYKKHREGDFEFFREFEVV